MDSITASRERLEFARVCIEITVNSKIPDYIDVLFYDDSIARIKVIVPWRPSSCVECKRFGHSVKFYPLGKKQEWRVKQTVHETKLEDAVNNSVVKIEGQNSIVVPEGSIQAGQIALCNTEGVVDTCLEKARAAIGEGTKCDTKLTTKEGPSGSNSPMKRGSGRPGKKQRATSFCVAKLVQDLKSKKKKLVDKVMKLEDRGGASSSLNPSC
ncbi:uncharacterized protein LOC120195277 [Hibiscus syriacus]|uniref:uncharacterized protein LOC120195277 n=1 Tax=Hibiscus syriacus TaxID=106335 RepID=UPI0019229A1A|nr:uncharacterized protein LOC120195277 [Hibiscus syriacus]